MSSPYVYPGISIHQGNLNFLGKHTEKTLTARRSLLSSVKTQSSGGFWSSKGVLDLDKPKIITNLYQQSKWTTWKNRVIRSYRKPSEPGLKLKIQLLAEFCPPSMWHKIHWYLWTIGKSVFQTSNTKEFKIQGADCQGPTYSWFYSFKLTVTLTSILMGVLSNTCLNSIPHRQKKCAETRTHNNRKIEWRHCQLEIVQLYLLF